MNTENDNQNTENNDTTDVEATATEAKKPSRPGIPYDDVDALLARVCDARYGIAIQSAFTKVEGPNGHRLYVANQAIVRRIDLAFTPAVDGLARGAGLLKPRKDNGAIEHELDTSAPEALTRLEQILRWMAEAPVVVKEKRQAFVPKLKAVAQRKANMTPEELAQEEQARKARVERYLKEKQGGVALSESASSAL